MSSVPITGLDHVMLAVADLTGAADRLSDALGLAVGRDSVHPQWGTANALVRLDGGYLELITVVDRGVAGDRPAVRRMTEVMADGGGWLAFVLGTDDVWQTWHELAGRGLPVARPLSGRSERPDGAVREWAVAAHGEEFGSGRLPSLISYGGPAPPPVPVPVPAGPKPEITGVVRVDVAVADLAAGVERYSLLFGAPPPGADPLWRLPGGVVVRLVDRPAAREGLYAVALGVPDLCAAREALTGRGTAFTAVGPGEIEVDPAATAPARIALVETAT